MLGSDIVVSDVTDGVGGTGALGTTDGVTEVEFITVEGLAVAQV